MEVGRCADTMVSRANAPRVTMNRIFVVMDRFDIKGKGLCLVGTPTDEASPLEVGQKVIIRRMGRPEIETVILGFEQLRNCFSPHLPRPFAVLVSESFAADDVPSGSEVWAYGR